MEGPIANPNGNDHDNDRRETSTTQMELFHIIEKQYKSADGITHQDVDRLREFLKRYHDSWANHDDDNTLNMNAYNDDKMTPLQMATYFVNAGEITEERENVTIEVIMMLIENGADMNMLIEHKKAIFEFNTRRNATILHWACMSCTDRIIRTLLQHGADPNIRDANNSTPLLYAALFRNRLAMEALLESSSHAAADLVDIQDRHGLAPVHMIFMLPDRFQIEANFNKWDNFQRCLQLLFENNANMNLKDKEGFTPLFQATLMHLNFPEHADATLRIVRYLLHEARVDLSIGVDVDSTLEMDVPMTTGDTPLHHAASCFSVPLVTMMLEYDPDLSIRNKNGQTALHKPLELVKLCKYQLRFNRDDANSDRPAIDVAVDNDPASDHPAVDAEIDDMTELPLTFVGGAPDTYAALSDAIRLVTMMLHHYPNCNNLRNQNGETILDLLKKYRFQEIAEILDLEQPTATKVIGMTK